MKEIRLNQVDNPIAYVMTILRRSSRICECLQTTRKPYLSSIYKDHEGEIDAAHRDVNVAWNSLRGVVVDAGSASADQDQVQKKLGYTIVRAIEAAQKSIDLFDILCDQYDLAKNEMDIFIRIGSILHS